MTVNASFVSPHVERFGDLRVGRGVFVTATAVLSADPGRRVCIGSRSNVQDNVLVLANARTSPARGRCAGRRGTVAGRRTSLAHQAQIVDSDVGDFTFVGFNARIIGAVLEDGAFVLHGAVVRGVRVRADRLVPVGARITTQAQADALPRKAEAQADFQEEVLEVNEEFAEHYARLYAREGHAGVTGVSRSPRTGFNPGRRPTIGRGLEREAFSQITGDVRLGADVRVGRRTSIRADEGSPIIVGDRARIEDRVTFHALKNTSIRIGAGLETEDNVVFHGPLVAGDRLRIRDDAILFRAAVGDDVTIGVRAVVVGPADDPIELPSGTVVPHDAVITTQAQADALRR